MSTITERPLAREEVVHDQFNDSNMDYAVLFQVRVKNNDACRCLHAGDGLGANHLLQDALSIMKQCLNQKPVQNKYERLILSSSSSSACSAASSNNDDDIDDTESFLEERMDDDDEDIIMTGQEGDEKCYLFSIEDGTGYDNTSKDAELHVASNSAWEIIKTVALPTTSTTTPPPSLPIHTYQKAMLISQHQLENYNGRAIVAMLCYNLALVHHHHNRQSFEPAIRFYELSSEILDQLEATLHNDDVHAPLVLLLQTAITNNLACSYASRFNMPDAMQWFEQLQHLARHSLIDTDDQELFFLNASVVQSSGMRLAPAA